MLDGYSLRIDHRLNSKFSIFGRYNYSPSDLILRGHAGRSASSVSLSRTTMQTATVGTTFNIKSHHFAFLGNYAPSILPPNAYRIHASTPDRALSACPFTHLKKALSGKTLRLVHAPLRGASGAKTQIQKQENLMQQTEPKPLFDLGQLVVMPGALAALEKSGKSVSTASCSRSRPSVAGRRYRASRIAWRETISATVRVPPRAFH